ncbi:MAG: poly-gamma-glutamate synthesis protein involved in capsule biosynthesis [Solirubrobacterales bacterium]|nr:poly-gamma-glutamate synthesis protein involved in capsule biosynthesis [Solirubrobacterales bacterium]
MRVRLAALAGIAVLAGCGGAGGRGAGPAAPPAITASDVQALPTTAPTKLPGQTILRIVASGDFLIHQPVWDRALALGHGHYDFRPLFARVRPIIRGADLALCHIETPLIPGTPQGYPVFRTPPALARAVKWAGWDLCSTASNHTVDAGQAGVDSTIAALDRAGLRHAGSARSAAGARHVAMARVKGIRVALLAYTQVSNGIPSPHPWSLNMADAPRILRDARRARAAGAQVVIVNLHWGDEYVNAPSAAQRALAERLTRSPAITALVGQHVHVVQPIRRVHGKVVVYGEGNLVSNQTADCCAPGSQDGIIAVLRVRVRGAEAKVTRVRAIPIYVRHPDFTVIPVRRALAHGSPDAAALRASLRRTRAALGSG